jgi:hypothetical protein
VDAGVLETERIHLCPHAPDDDSIEQQVGGGVVADGGHEPGRVMHGENGPIVEKLDHPRARDLIDLEYGQRIVQRELSLRHQIVNGGENRDLDETGSRKCLIAAPVYAGAGLQIDNAVPDDTVMSIGDGVELPTQRSGIGVNYLRPGATHMARPRRGAGQQPGENRSQVSGERTKGVRSNHLFLGRESCE